MSTDPKVAELWECDGDYGKLYLYFFYSVQWFLCIFVGTVDNHRNTEITETVIFVKCGDFAKMP